MTAQEYLELLRSKGIEKELLEKIKKVLEICDLVKFAKYYPSSEEF